MSSDILIGQIFERLTIVGHATPTPAGLQRVMCRCICGTEKPVMLANLRKGRTKSCGCFSRERAPFKHRTHGHRRTPEYGVWSTMRQRCTNPRSKKFAEYGARGITVCNRWIESFENFLADMGERPSPKHTIERIDNARGYQPDNCTWAIQRTQQQNRRDNNVVTYQGESLCISEWTRRLDLPVGLVSQRLHRLGWTVEKALNTPSQAERWTRRKFTR